jgi:hypothetical protein
MFSMGLPTPQPIVMRPLLGIDWIASELNAIPGSLLDAQNVVVRPKGLYRIPGYDSFLSSAAWIPADNPCIMASGWGTNGVQYPFLFTENYIFLCSWTNGYVRVPWTYSAGTISTTGTAAVGIGTLWKTLGINTGDSITIAGVTYLIDLVNSDTSLTLHTSAGSQSTQAYSISRLLGAGNNSTVDSCEVQDITLGDYLVATAPNNQMVMIIPPTQAVSNLTATAAKQPASGGFMANCCAYFVGRVFAGNLQDGSLGSARTRIRWSKTTDTTDFSDATAYIDLLSQGSGFSGSIQRMMPMGTLLVVYLDDAIFVGSPSNTPNLPLSFQQLPTGRIGIAGPRAVSSLMLPRTEENTYGINTTGHFFVGFDNVYFLSSSSLALEPIGNRIVRESILRCLYPNRIQTSVDWQRKRVRFGFPRSGPNIENIFEYDWETKEWSYEFRNTWMLADPLLTPPVNVVMTTVTLVTMTTVLGISMSPSPSANTILRAHYIEQNGRLWNSSTNENAVNPDGTANPIQIETMDYDEGAAGMVKFWRMLRLKISYDPETIPNIDIVFAISISLDRGRSYRPIGNMTIKQGNDEGYVNFRATGPHIRFLITSVSAVTPYYITELTRLASIRGVQSSLRQQNAIH